MPFVFRIRDGLTVATASAGGAAHDVAMAHRPRTRRVAIVTRGDGRVLVARCQITDTARGRLIGLLGRPNLRPGDGVWLTPCRGVHTMAMRMPIACALVDGDGRVLALRDPLPPWRTFGTGGARAALECAPGVLAGVRVGDVLRVEDVCATPRTWRSGG